MKFSSAVWSFILGCFPEKLLSASQAPLGCFMKPHLGSLPWGTPLESLVKINLRVLPCEVPLGCRLKLPLSGCFVKLLVCRCKSPVWISIVLGHHLTLSINIRLTKYPSVENWLDENILQIFPKYVLQSVFYCVFLQLWIVFRFVLYVNGVEKVTDVSVNDGKWHHIAVTWQSVGGSWKIYKDGKLHDEGTGLAEGSIIEGLWN